MFARSIGIAIIGVFLLGLSSRVGALTLEGVVKDYAGRPIRGADVYIQTKDFSKVIRTDAAGHYKSDVMAARNYKVIVMVNGSVQAAIVNAEAPSGASARLNFNLSAQSIGASQRKRMVWVAPEIGTHIGNGSWVEVDEKDRPGDHARKMARTALPLDDSGRHGTNCICFGGYGSVGSVGLATGRTVPSFAKAQEPHIAAQ